MAKIVAPFQENEDGEPICPTCRHPLRANVGRMTGTKTTLVWWVCHNCVRVTAVVPVPPGVNELTLRELLEGREECARL